MRSFLDCVPCFFSQAVRAARHVGLDEATSKRLLDELGQVLPSIDASRPPPFNAAFLYRRLAELSGREDPFADVKREHTELALSLEPAVRSAIDTSRDRLDASARLAAAGNLLDVGALAEIGDVEKALGDALQDEYERWQIEGLREALSSARSVLVIGDNAGETVLDRMLIENLHWLWPQLDVSYAVRGGPIINDAVEEDARAAGLHRVATIVSTGSALPGIIMDEVSEAFRRLFMAADVVISKGQGNFETLSDSERELFFILTIKCQVVAAHLRLPMGFPTLIHHRPDESSGSANRTDPG